MFFYAPLFDLKRRFAAADADAALFCALRDAVESGGIPAALVPLIAGPADVRAFAEHAAPDLAAFLAPLADGAAPDRALRFARELRGAAIGPASAATVGALRAGPDVRAAAADIAEFAAIHGDWAGALFVGMRPTAEGARLAGLLRAVRAHMDLVRVAWLVGALGDADVCRVVDRADARRFLDETLALSRRAPESDDLDALEAFWRRFAE